MTTDRRAGPHNLDARAAAAAVRRQEVSPRALLDDAWARAAQWEPWLGAIVRPLDRIAPTAHGPLAGVVVGVKDALAVAGHPLSAGAPDAVDLTPQPQDATAVAGLADAGATLMALTQVHPLCFGVVTPAVRNPRSPDRIAGGSSGGSAALLAAGIVHVALGTDSGGSVRGPAACCGVVGLKTTRGLVGLSGAFELTWSLDTIGPMATSVADVELALAALLLQDPADPVQRSPAPLRPIRPGPLTVGVPRQMADVPLDTDVELVWRETLDDLSADGHRVVEVEAPGLLEAPRANGIILSAEAAAIHHNLVDAPEAVLAAHVRERLQRGATLMGTEVVAARRQAVVFARRMEAVFAEVDVLCTPTLPCRIPGVGQDEVAIGNTRIPTTFAMTTLTNPWNLLGNPAGSVPAGRDRGGAPVGVQLIGPWWGEPTVLRAMEATERVRGGAWSTAEAADVRADEELQHD